jgi:hypothetical protein
MQLNHDIMVVGEDTKRNLTKTVASKGQTGPEFISF